MQQGEWEVIAGQLFLAYPNTAAGPETIALYGQHLAEFPTAVVSASVQYLVHEAPREFLPPIGLLVQQCRQELASWQEREKLARGTIEKLGLSRALAMWPEWHVLFPELVAEAKAGMPGPIEVPELETPDQVEARLLAEANERAGAIPGSPAEIKTRIKELGAP